MQGRGANMTSELAQACAYITDAANYMTHQKEKSVNKPHILSVCVVCCHFTQSTTVKPQYSGHLWAMKIDHYKEVASL